LAIKVRQSAGKSTTISSAISADSKPHAPTDDRESFRTVHSEAIAMSDDLRFDPVAFLASAGFGLKLVGLKAKETFFLQGDAADCVIYLQSGCAKLTVFSAQTQHC
jgi:CRP-like cAMP-binding protein